MKYAVWDMRHGLLSDDEIVVAKSPMEAVKKLGYESVTRVMYGGDIVVSRKEPPYAMYLYRGVMPK